MIKFFVPGAPAPQGSKRHVGHGRMVESSKALGPWRERVALAAHSHADGLMGGPIGIRLKFVMPRPKSTPKRTTPPAVKRPDIDKISRAILDAITGVIIADDSQVVDLHATKRLAELDESHGVHIELEQLDLIRIEPTP
ncbi:RusA family crossover junction endodeoxyribonuclease [Rhodococcus erythropolis]